VVAVERLVDIAVAVGIGVNIRFLPTWPLELARPLGKRPDTELSSSRGVPTPLQATMTTSAGWNCSSPLAS